MRAFISINDTLRAMVAAAMLVLPAGAAHAKPATPHALTPAPLPPGAKADTPGGAARNGVIAPPAGAADPKMNRGAPAATHATPVIPPPGSLGGNPTVVPK